MNTSADAPYLDCAYKLVEYEGRPKRKRSEGKATWPGRKQIYRRVDAGGRIAGDVLTVEGDRQQDVLAGDVLGDDLQDFVFYGDAAQVHELYAELPAEELQQLALVDEFFMDQQLPQFAAAGALHLQHFGQLGGRDQARGDQHLPEAPGNIYSYAFFGHVKRRFRYPYNTISIGGALLKIVSIFYPPREAFKRVLRLIPAP